MQVQPASAVLSAPPQHRDLGAETKALEGSDERKPDCFGRWLRSTTTVQARGLISALHPPKHVKRQCSGPPALRLGRWLGRAGESGWLSDHPRVRRVTQGEAVPFRHGFPNFTRWAQACIRFPPRTLHGNAKDARLATSRLAVARGISEAELRAFCRKRWVWHHCEDGRTMLLLPRDLHGHIPHRGGTSILRQRSGLGGSSGCLPGSNS